MGAATRRLRQLVPEERHPPLCVQIELEVASLLWHNCRASNDERLPPGMCISAHADVTSHPITPQHTTLQHIKLLNFASGHITFRYATHSAGILSHTNFLTTLPLSHTFAPSHTHKLTHPLAYLAACQQHLQVGTFWLWPWPPPPPSPGAEGWLPAPPEALRRGSRRLGGAPAGLWGSQPQGQTRKSSKARAVFAAPPCC